MSHVGFPVRHRTGVAAFDRLSLRTALAARAGLLAGRSSTALRRGHGGTIAGLVTLRLAPRALAELTAGRRVVLISGTNGKTTTTRFVTVALQTRGEVVTNADGDNLARGLVSALVRGRHAPYAPAVLEVDEAALPAVVEQTRPSVVVLLNLSRDQLDRTGEVAHHVLRWTKAFTADRAAVLVANADDPLVTAVVLAARPRQERVVWVAAGSTWRADARRCPQCSGRLSGERSYRCEDCEFARPEPTWTVEGDELRGPSGGALPLALALPGAANRGNAAQAVAAAVTCDVPVQEGLRAVRAVDVVSGRYLHTRTAGHEVQFLLAKNPAGWAEALAVLAERVTPLVIAINARDADGHDPSWLWDAPFELLRGRCVVATGERRWDLAVRLTHAGVEHTTAPTVREALAQVPDQVCDVVANYTAFRAAQAELLA